MMNMSRPSANTGMLLQCAQITMRIYQDDVLGIVINKNQNHWMSFRMENDQIWNPDSLHQPRRGFAKRNTKRRWMFYQNALSNTYFFISQIWHFLFLFLGSNTYSSVVLCATDEISSVILNKNISDVVTRQRTPQLLLIASCSTLLRSILHEEVLLFLLFVLARCGEPYYTIKNLYASTFFDSQVCCLSYLYSLW